MTVNTTSSYAISYGMRTQVMRLQSDLTKAQAEASSGQIQDIGLAQGLSTARTLSFDYQQTEMSTIIDTNQITSSRLDTTNQALSQMLSIAQEFTTQLTSVKTSKSDPSVLVAQAKASLQSVISALSTTFSGAYVFSGVASNIQPIPNYPGSPSSDGKLAVDAAFQNAFSINQSNAGVANITDTAMKSFLDNTFPQLFNDTGWPSFFKGSSTQLTARVGINDTSSASVTANDQGIRDLIASLVAVSDLGGQNMNTTTFGVVIDKAMQLAGSAQTGITASQTQVGLMESKIKSSTDNLTAQKDIMQKAYTQATSVDQYEVATRVNQLTTQLQTAYSLTSRMQQLSLLQYLPVA